MHGLYGAACWYGRALARCGLVAWYKCHRGDHALPRQGTFGFLQVGLGAGSEIKSAELKQAVREPPEASLDMAALGQD